MRYIVPTNITDSMLAHSSVPETDHAAWSAAAAYTVGARCIRATTHSIYERLAAGTTATPPEDDPVNWARVGPTNRWAMFDGAVGTLTTATGEITVTVAPGTLRGLALLDLDIEALTITMTAGAAVVYSRVYAPLGSLEDVGDWYGYFFDSISRRRSLVLTDLPAYAEGVLTITATGTGPISIGSCIVGALYELGTVQEGASVGIIDYSRKQTDDFGATTVAERSYAKRMTVPIVLDTSAVSMAADRLARIRARPVVWIGSADIDALVVYGFVKQWSVDIPGRVLSTCSLDIEGLV